MKRIISIILSSTLLLISCEKEISEVQAERFVKFYGSYSLDRASEVEVLDDGGYAVTGTATFSDSITKMILIITDQYGNAREGFPQYYTDQGLNAGANSLIAVNGGSGGYLLSGYILVPDGAGEYHEDLFVVRVSSDGSELWKRTFGSDENESILHSVEGITSGFVLSGYQEENEEKDIMIMRITETGDSVSLGLNYNKPDNSDDATANYLLRTDDGYLCVCSYDKAGNEGSDILVLLFDDELSPNDEVQGGSHDEYGKCIIHDEGNRYLILGDRLNTTTDRNEITIYFIETSGSLITNSGSLATITGVNEDLYAERFVKSASGKLGIIGTRYSNENYDIILQFFENGEETDRKIFGNTGTQTGADIDHPESGGFIMVGTNGFEGNSMISLIKTDEDGDL